MALQGTYFKQTDIYNYSKENTGLNFTILENAEIFNQYQFEFAPNGEVMVSAEPFKKALSDKDWRHLTATIVSHHYIS